MAEEMKCKYCGQQLKTNGGATCTLSPIKIHVGIPDSKNCVYCGYEFYAGTWCNFSPSKEHQLAS